MQQNLISSSANRGGQNRLKADSHFTNSHTLPKIAISLALLLSGANVAFAEESGGFVGIGIGGGGTLASAKFEVGEKAGLHKYTRGGINYGFVVGYKQFFTPYLGLRYYANLDIHHNMTKDKIFNNADTYENKRRDITLINYGVNVDFLGNFVSTEIADFGGFIGLGIGGNTLTGKFIKDMKNAAKDPMIGKGVKVTDTAFDIWLNFGLRTNIATNHGIEVAVRVPFLPITYMEDKIIGTKMTFRQEYSVLARYAFSF